MYSILDHFTLQSDRESPETIVATINDGVEFQGANLWILIFAILIASLGLNLNSTAVIIGAMLISPLMGPIMGVGLGLGINDLSMVRTSFVNLCYAAIVGLLSSTLYFSITPLNDAHSELLARTYPTVYDVLIAFFGGLAGMIAIASRKKGNVLPGVAIATALMPPLCTAGYGLASGHLNYFFGAFYLFLINTVFIATSTFVTARLMRLPIVHLLDPRAEARAHRIVIGIVVVTLLPSVYLGYDLVMQERFTKQAHRFIEAEGAIPNDYLLNRKIDAKERSIVLTYGGSEIPDEYAESMRSKLTKFNLDGVNLEIKQGFSYLNDKADGTPRLSLEDMTRTLHFQDSLVRRLRTDSTQRAADWAQQILLLKQIRVLDPNTTRISINKNVHTVDSIGSQHSQTVVLLQSKRIPNTSTQQTVSQLLTLGLQDSSVRVVYLHEN